MNTDDKRKVLEPGCVLALPGMKCAITGILGRGSNGIVYRAEYKDAASSGLVHEVLIKELFPLHPNGAVFRAENGEIRVLPEGEEVWSIHKRSFERGNAFHVELLKRHPEMIGANLNTFPLNGTFYTILGCSGGTSMNRLPAPVEGLKGVAERMVGIIDALEVFHDSNCLHMDISPDNVLIIPQSRREQVLLIDYNSVLSLEDWANGGEIMLSAKEGYTAPEIMNGDFSGICFGTDLYAVAAVFYECLMGRTLDLWDMICGDVPDISESEYIAGCPQTVRSMAEDILARGLASVPEMRYQTADEMRKDFTELTERIDRVGVTHWALWEKENASLNRMVIENPSLAFLREDGEKYPIRITHGDKTLSTDELTRRNGITLLMAQSGMGKTTALLSAALRQNRRYNPVEPVAVYISAYDCREGEKWFIHDRMLNTLKFSRDIKTYEGARHELELLLSQPITSGGEKRPSVVLLLDGINEMGCDPKLLTDELTELSKLEGLSIVLASRIPVEGLECCIMTLAQLTEDDIQTALSSKGMLLPESEEVKQLIRTPLMLSMYIRAAEEGAVRINGADELMRAVIRRETGRYTEDTPEYWQTDAALSYVLPAIAAEQKKRGRALEESELARVTGGCWKVLRSKSMIKAFPRWIGHRKAILGGCTRVDEWFGLIALELLWRRTGFILRDEQGAYRIVHQRIGEFMAEAYIAERKKVVRRKSLRLAFSAALTAAVLLACWRLVWVPYIQPVIDEMQVVKYDEQKAADVLESEAYAYTAAINQTDCMLSMVEMARAVRQGEITLNDFDCFYYQPCMSTLEQLSSPVTRVMAACRAEDMMAGMPDDAVMPFSGETIFLPGRYAELTGAPEKLAAEYIRYLKILRLLLEDDTYFSFTKNGDDQCYGEKYLTALETGLNADLVWVSGFYSELLDAEIKAVQLTNEELYSKLKDREGLKLYEYKPADPSVNRETAWDEVKETPPVTHYTETLENDAQATGWTETGIPKEQYPDMSSDKLQLITAWDTMLATVEWQNAYILWGLDRIDDYLKNPTWDNLTIAREACIEVYDALSIFSWPEMQLTDEQLKKLYSEGVAIEILTNYRMYDNTSLATTFRLIMFGYLDERWYSEADMKSLAQLSDGLRQYVEACNSNLRIETNYLYLSVIPTDELEKWWEATVSAYSMMLFRDSVVYEMSSDKSELEKLQGDSSAELGEASEAWSDAFLNPLSRDQNSFYALVKDRRVATIKVSGFPTLLPTPYWYNSEKAEYLYYTKDADNKNTVLSIGNTALDVNTMVKQPGVSRYEVMKWLKTLERYGISYSDRGDDRWTVDTEEYTFDLSWSEDSTLMRWLGSSEAFIPGIYMDDYR